MRRVGMWMLLQVCCSKPTRLGGDFCNDEETLIFLDLWDYKMCDVMGYDIYMFVSARSIKENFVGLENFQYPSNL
ncbi:hypothetical protein BD769DRAFT_1495125, partial [Suillus cothurnatus]